MLSRTITLMLTIVTMLTMATANLHAQPLKEYNDQTPDSFPIAKFSYKPFNEFTSAPSMRCPPSVTLEQECSIADELLAECLPFSKEQIIKMKKALCHLSKSDSVGRQLLMNMDKELKKFGHGSGASAKFAPVRSSFRGIEMLNVDGKLQFYCYAGSGVQTSLGTGLGAHRFLTHNCTHENYFGTFANIGISASIPIVAASNGVASAGFSASIGGSIDIGMDGLDKMMFNLGKHVQDGSFTNRTFEDLTTLLNKLNSGEKKIAEDRYFSIVTILKMTSMFLHNSLKENSNSEPDIEKFINFATSEQNRILVKHKDNPNKFITKALTPSLKGKFKDLKNILGASYDFGVGIIMDIVDQHLTGCYAYNLEVGVDIGAGLMADLSLATSEYTQILNRPIEALKLDPFKNLLSVIDSSSEDKKAIWCNNPTWKELMREGARIAWQMTKKSAYDNRKRVCSKDNSNNIAEAFNVLFQIMEGKNKKCSYGAKESKQKQKDLFKVHFQNGLNSSLTQ